MAKKKVTKKKVTKKKTRSLKKSTGVTTRRNTTARRGKSSSSALPTRKTRPAVKLSQYISMFFGPPGVGKTTFVNKISDSVLFLSTDRGTRFMEAMRVECLDWKAFKSVIEKLKKTGAPEYEYICIDHVDDWARLCENSVCEQLGIKSLSDAEWGKGWKVFKDELYGFLAELKALDIGIIFIAHETTKEVEKAGLKVDVCQPDIPKNAWKAIVPLCDIIGYCGIRPVQKNGKRVDIRTLETEPKRDLFAKDRSTRKRPSGERNWEILDGHKFLSTFGDK